MKEYILNCTGTVSVPQLSATFHQPSDRMAIEYTKSIIKLIAHKNIYRFMLWEGNTRMVADFHAEQQVAIRPIGAST